ncbi:hypothetical protein P3G55_14715 [Leptospira sp. 96542]|nr:hypothetical protein [Leptospira sp. 96542]
MAQSQKLYQILEKAHIETKIAVEIQDWIIDTLEESREKAMIQIGDTKLLPIQLEMRTRFDAIDSKFDAIDSKFDAINSKFNAIDSKFDAINSRFDSLEKRIDATNFSIRLLGVPIIGATIGGLSMLFLNIYERLM